MDFLLMNKNVAVVSFKVDSIANSIRVTGVINKQLIPLPIHRNVVSFPVWLNNRLMMSYRRDVVKLFTCLGVVGLRNMLLCTRAISLLDNYWVKPLNEVIIWERVSPYRNPLNELVANYSITGTINGKNISASPDFSTGGSFIKCWKKVNGNIYLYKAGSDGALNSGKEPYSEYLYYELGKRLGLDVVEYEIVEYKDRVCTRCKNLCSEDEGLYEIADMYPYVNDYEFLLKTRLSKEPYKDQIKKLVDMLLLDFLTLNTDRHLGNIGVIVDNATQEPLRVATNYDFNLSLMPYLIKGYESVDDAYNSEDNVVHRYSSLGMSFDDLLLLLIKYAGSAYIKRLVLMAKDFRFSSNIERSDIATEILSKRVERALKLIER